MSEISRSNRFYDVARSHVSPGLRRDDGVFYMSRWTFRRKTDYANVGLLWGSVRLEIEARNPIKGLGGVLS